MKGRKFLAGFSVHMLVVIADLPIRNRHSWCLVRCDCGKTREVRSDEVLRGKVKSCGCQTMRHGHAGRGDRRSPTWVSWRSMKQRCNVPGANGYARYGGRGITVCERWNASFAAFLEDMGERPRGTTLDRIDNSKGYEPGNCRWTTVKEQQRNQRGNRLLTYRGETKCLTAWAETVGAANGIGYSALNHRINRGWAVERALTEPVQVRRCINDAHQEEAR